MQPIFESLFNIVDLVSKVLLILRRHACISCGELGEFPVRSGHTAGTKQAPIVFLVCKR